MRPSLPIALSFLVLVATAARAAPEPGRIGRGTDVPVAVGDAPRSTVRLADDDATKARARVRAGKGRRAAAAVRDPGPQGLDLPTPLAVGQYQVRRADFATFASQTRRPMGEGCMVLDGGMPLDEARGSFPDSALAQGDHDPLLCIDVEDAEAYVAWLSHVSGREQALPHEAEWRYAALAGATVARGWGDDLGSGSNAIGSSPARAYGLGDMLGDVWTWTADRAVPDRAYSPLAVEDGRRASQDRHAPDLPHPVTRVWLLPMADSSNGFRSVREPEDRPAR